MDILRHPLNWMTYTYACLICYLAEVLHQQREDVILPLLGKYAYSCSC